MRHSKSSDWSFLLMRGPDQSVKQFNVTKRSLIATPVALIAIVSSCIIGLQLQSSHELQKLVQQQKVLRSQYDELVLQQQNEIQSKQEEISSLKTQLESLQQEKHLITEKLAELEQLEAQLQDFIQSYGEDVPISLDREVEPLQTTSNSNYHFATMAYQANAPIEQMTTYIQNLQQDMEQTLKLAKQVRQEVDSYPNYWPTSSTYISSGFGYRSDPFTKKIRFHAGIDIAGKRGDTVFSAANGAVIETGSDSEYGRYIIIEHSDSLQTVYMHLDTIEAKSGDEVVKGEKIGTMGNTGRSTGNHLHFQVIHNNSVVSPTPYLYNEKQINDLPI